MYHIVYKTISLKNNKATEAGLNTIRKTPERNRLFIMKAAVWSKSEKGRRFLSEMNIGNKYFLDKQHSEETKKKMSEKAKINSNGSANSQYGTCWITKDNENKKIKKEDIDEWLILGWIKGRFQNRKNSL